jgi:hypothetical protein
MELQEALSFRKISGKTQMPKKFKLEVKVDPKLSESAESIEQQKCNSSQSFNPQVASSYYN